MAKQRPGLRPQQQQQPAPQMVRAPAALAEEEESFELDDLAGNQAFADQISGSVGSGGPPPSGDPLDDPGGDPEEVPFLSEMQSAFGQKTEAEAYTGQGEALGAINARAAARPGKMVFADERPDKETVAEEYAHQLQFENAGTAAAGPGVSSPGSAPEQEAKGAASDVARGGKARITGGAPGLTHRKDGAAPAAADISTKGTEEDLAGVKYLVFPDGDWEAAKPKAPVGEAAKGKPTWINRTGFVAKQRKIEDTAKAKELVAAIIKIVQGSQSPFQLSTKVSDLVNTYPPGARAIAFQSDALWNAEALKDAKIALEIAKGLDPVEGLRKTLSSKSKATLANVIQWTRSFPDFCDRALEDGGIQVNIENNLAGNKTEARLYLIAHGDWRTNPKDACFIAVEKGEDGAFVTAFKQLGEDQKRELIFDALFIHKARENLEYGFGVVMDAMREVGVQSGMGVEFSQDDKDALQPKALETAELVKKALQSYNGAAALSALLSYQAIVLDRLKHHDGSDAGKATAITSVSEGMKLVTEPINAAMGWAILPALLGAIRGRGQEREAVEINRILTGGTQEIGKLFVEFSTDLTEADRDWLGKVVPGRVEALAKLATPMPGGDREARFTELLTQFRMDVIRFIVSDQPGNNEADWAATERRRKATAEFKVAFKGRTGFELEQAIKMCTSGFNQVMALGGLASMEKEQDLEDNANLYTAELTDLDRQRLKSAWSSWGDKMNGEFHRWNTRDDVIIKHFRGLDEDTAKLTKPKLDKPEFVKLWKQKKMAAMDAFIAWYNSAYEGLEHEITDHINQPQCDEARRIVGIHRDENVEASEELLGGEGSLAMAEDVENWKKICAATAQKFEGVLGAALTSSTDWGIIDWAGTISDSDVLGVAGAFKGLKEIYVKKLGPEFGADASNYLLREFKARGGKIQPAIRRAVSEKSANECFARLGIEGSTAPKVNFLQEMTAGRSELEVAANKPEEEKKATDAVAFEKEMGSRIDALSRGFTGDWSAVEGSETMESNLIFLVGSARVVYARAVAFKGGDQLLKDTWKSRLGIPLENDVGLHVKAPIARQKLAEALHLDASKMPRPRNGFLDREAQAVVGEMVALSNEMQGGADQSKLPPELKFEVQGVKDGFDLKVAASRAAQLKYLADRLPMSRPQLEMALVGPNGMQEETRVTLEVFKRMYGYSLKYALKMAYKDTPEEAERIEDFATGAFNKKFVAQMLAYANYGDMESARAAALKASPDEKKALFNDDAALNKMRNAFGEKKYKIIYRAITDQVSMYELIEDRGGNLFGWGTDKEEMQDDFKNWFEGKRRELMKDPELNKRAGGDTAKLKELVKIKMQELAARTFADPNVVSQIEHEFSGDDKFEMEARLLNQGELNGGDQVITDLVGLGTTDSVWSHLEAMSDEEKAKARKNPMFMGFLADDLENEGDAKRDQGFEELFSNSGANQEAKFEEILGDHNSSQQSGQNRHGGPPVDQLNNSRTRKFFDQVFSMGPEELAEFKKDRVRLNELRSKLSEADLATFDTYMASAQGVLDKTGGTEPTTDSQKKQQKRLWLVQKFTGQFLAAIQGGGDAILSVAQDAFTEKGEIEVEIEKDGTKTKEKVECFDKAARLTVWNNIKGDYGSKVNGANVSITRGSEVYAVVRKSLTDHTNPANDPAPFRYDWAVSGSRILGMERDDVALESINKASPQYVAQNWSNVLKTGVGEPASKVPMKQKYDVYKTARSAVETKTKQFMSLQDKGQMNDKLQETLASEITTLNDDYMLKYRNFKQHQIDLSVEAWKLFGDADDMEEVNETASGADRGKTANSRVQAVQKKLLGLSGEDIATACGVDKDAAGYDLDVKEFMSADRQTRATWSHDKQQYNRQADGSIADGTTNADEELDLAFMMYTAEVGEATSGRDGMLGEITEEEKERIDDKKGNFDKKLEEYKKAKTLFADILKWIAIAIITVVATALTGPGGPTLLAALLTGAATGVAKAGIDELVQGNDYDFATEGVQTILVETLTSVATVGLGKAVKFAGGKFPGVQNVIDRFDKFAKWEEAVKEGATKSLPGFAGNLIYETGKATVMAPMTALKDSAVESLDLGYWKYGTFAGTAHAEDVFDTNLSGLDAKLKEEYLTILITNVADVGMSGLFGKDNKTLDGVDVGAAPEQKQSLAMDVLSGVVGANSPEKLAAAIKKEGISVVVDKMMKGTLLKSSGWTTDDLTGFVTKIAKGQLDKSLDATAGAIQGWNQTRLKEKRLEEAKGQFKSLSGDELDAAMAHYKHYLENDAFMYGAGEELGADPKAWLAEWQNTTQKAVNAHVLKTFKESGSTDLDAKVEYKKWLLANPGKTNDRMNVSFKDFQGANLKAQNTVVAIKASASYKSLSEPDRRFYDEYLSKSDRLISQDAVTDDLSVGGLDIRSEKGLSDFKKQVTNTRATIATNIALADDEKKFHADAFNAWLKANPKRLEVFSPDATRNNEIMTDILFDEFAAKKGIVL